MALQKENIPGGFLSIPPLWRAFSEFSEVTMTFIGETRYNGSCGFSVDTRVKHTRESLVGWFDKREFFFTRSRFSPSKFDARLYKAMRIKIQRSRWKNFPRWPRIWDKTYPSLKMHPRHLSKMQISLKSWSEMQMKSKSFVFGLQTPRSFMLRGTKTWLPVSCIGVKKPWLAPITSKPALTQNDFLSEQSSGKLLLFNLHTKRLIGGKP